MQTLLRKSLRASATPTAVRDDDWLQAQRYARELGKVLDGAGPRRLAIARAAAELDLTTRQIYNLLKRYASDRSVSALLPQKSRPRRKRLAGEVEAIIAVTLREHWLVLEAPPWRLSSPKFGRAAAPAVLCRCRTPDPAAVLGRTDRQRPLRQR